MHEHLTLFLYEGDGMKRTITIENFGFEGAKKFRLTNKKGMTVELSNYGARLVSIILDFGNEKRQILKHYKSGLDYQMQDTYIGASIGPVAGRIRQGRAEIEGTVHQFEQNDGEHTLHGGQDGYETILWDYFINQVDNSVSFSKSFPRQYKGFPGKIWVTITFTLFDDNQLGIEYEAKSDTSTLFSPTSHVYFNLTGDDHSPVDDHELTIKAQRFVELGKDYLPTGQLMDVSDTPFDFRNKSTFSKGFMSNHPQITLANGFDHAFVLDRVDWPVEVESPDHRVILKLSTDEKVVVIYTYNHGEESDYHSAFSLETQAIPNTANEPSFGSIILKKGETYRSSTRFAFEF